MDLPASKGLFTASSVSEKRGVAMAWWELWKFDRLEFLVDNLSSLQTCLKACASREHFTINLVDKSQKRFLFEELRDCVKTS